MVTIGKKKAKNCREEKGTVIEGVTDIRAFLISGFTTILQFTDNMGIKL